MRLEISKAPPSANELRRKYRTVFAYRDLRMAWEKDLTFCTSGAVETIAFKSQAAKNKRLSLVIHVYRRRELDFDNMVAGCKPIIDALVNIGYLGGDSSERLHCEIKQASPFKPRTVIEINPA
jgi:hypothetical protein